MTLNAYSSTPSATDRRPRRALIALGIVCLALVGGALYFQYARGEDPCPLCILQRYGFLLVALFAFCAAAFPRRGAGRTLFVWLALLSALGGGIAAARHVWILASMRSCGFDVLQPIVDGLPPARWLPGVFRTAGLCETPYPPVLGLSLPTWSLIGFVAAGVALLVARRGRGRD
ncbi:disulfide bond formation protein B [Robbsia sp. Bb-Pol-6]|uniref:Disulfide bond formation protein B n=1 Tax=Robbsia betulipollinis TaxID=2981849 RepID=A0ABT3ZQG5_9BURK|nr:disulfide bond formation protein B [Robbsia betulipollinis]MCY0388657.1 disulfide bond formation protein B [Robbsia betulipollinis]